MSTDAVLIVVGQGVGGPELAAAIEARRDRARFHLLVAQPPSPSTAVAAGLAAVESVAYAATVTTLHDELRDVAERRLARGLDWIAGFDVDVDGEVGPTTILPTVVDVAERLGVSEIIVSTQPSRVSKWLRQDLPSRIRRALDREVPIEVVVSAEMHEDEPADARELIRAEERLLDPAFRADPDRLGAVLHPDFVEIGKSGRVFIKEGIVDELAADPGASVEATGYEVSFVADDVALVTYGVDSEPPSLRSSLWVRSDGRWMLRFHQGTVAPID